MTGNIGLIYFNLTFDGDSKDLPNYSCYAEYTFNDSESMKIPLNWSLRKDNQTYIHLISHIYYRFGTYYSKLTLTNNVSSLSIQRTVIVEQCVKEFRLTLHKTRYAFTIFGFGFLLLFSFLNLYFSTKLKFASLLGKC